MKKAIPSLALLLVHLGAAAQTNDYAGLVNQAVNYYQQKQYLLSAQTFSKAFAVQGGKGNVLDRYNAACVWTLVGNKDSAFFNLERIATVGNFSSYTMLTIDEDLKGLHDDKRWDALLNTVKQNKDKSEANLNKELVATLETILADDQRGRNQSGEIEKKYGSQSPEMKEFWAGIKKTDSANLIKVSAIIDKYGWPGPDLVGMQGCQAVFLVIQHSDIKTQEHYLPMMREAVKNKKAQASSLALLEDRVALRQGKKQVYGSQIHMGPDGEKWVSPLEDPDNVDKRRAEVGLEPLSSYLKYWNLEWDVAAYKKQLPDIEKKEKSK